MIDLPTNYQPADLNTYQKTLLGFAALLKTELWSRGLISGIYYKEDIEKAINHFYDLGLETFQTDDYGTYVKVSMFPSREGAREGILYEDVNRA